MGGVAELEAMVGSLFAGKYRIDGILGAGGMGTVVAATHVALARPIALKLMHRQIAGHPESVERMIREARASALLRSEHVAHVIDVGLERGVPYIVLELLAGEDLAAVLTRGPLRPATAVSYLLQAAEALAEAHAARIVHRDLKPQNLFLTQRPADGAPLIKVLDFGISKVELGVASSLTATGAVMGTPMYMAPEQLRSSRSVDPRGDIWSLGVCLYELLSGRRPFEGETFADLCLKIGVEPPPPLTSPHAPSPELAALEAIILRCLRKDPAERYQSIVELATALAPHGGEFAWSQLQRCIRMSGAATASAASAAAARTLVAAPATIPAPPTTTRQALGQLAAPPPETASTPTPTRRRWRLGLAATAIAASIFAMVALTLEHGEISRATPTRLERGRNDVPATASPPSLAPLASPPSISAPLPTAPPPAPPPLPPAATAPTNARPPPQPAALPTPTDERASRPEIEQPAAPTRITRPNPKAAKRAPKARSREDLFTSQE